MPDVSCALSGRQTRAIPKSVTLTYPRGVKNIIGTIIFKDEVLGLDVSVDNISLVDVLESSDHAGNKEPCQEVVNEIISYLSDPL